MILYDKVECFLSSDGKTLCSYISIIQSRIGQKHCGARHGAADPSYRELLELHFNRSALRKPLVKPACGENKLNTNPETDSARDCTLSSYVTLLKKTAHSAF